MSAGPEGRSWIRKVPSAATGAVAFPDPPSGTTQTAFAGGWLAGPGRTRPERIPVGAEAAVEEGTTRAVARTTVSSIRMAEQRIGTRPRASQEERTVHGERARTIAAASQGRIPDVRGLHPRLREEELLLLRLQADHPVGRGGLADGSGGPEGRPAGGDPGRRDRGPD